MTRRLESALARLELLLGANSRALVERVEMARDGELQFTIHRAGATRATRWFADTGESIREVHPEGDAQLAVCRRLTARAGDQSVRVLSWRPGRRITLEMRGGEATRVVKGFRAGRVARPAAVHERLSTHGGGPESFRIPQLLSWSESESSLAMERLDGRSLILSSTDAEEFRSVGRALLDLQRTVPTDGLALHGWEEELRALDSAGERARSLGVCPEGWMDLREQLQALEAPISTNAAVATHRDLHDEQLLLVDGRIGLLDHDLFTSSSSLLDPANLLAHMSLRVLQRRPGSSVTGARACEAAFREGFELSSNSETERGIGMLRAGTLLRLAAVYALRPRWPDLAPRLMALAKEELARVAC